jgi:hypothetical protein
VSNPAEQNAGHGGSHIHSGQQTRTGNQCVAVGMGIGRCLETNRVGKQRVSGIAARRQAHILRTDGGFFVWLVVGLGLAPGVNGYCAGLTGSVLG